MRSSAFRSGATPHHKYRPPKERHMPVTLSYPGVYIEELPSGVRTITGVATSITAFIGRALRGPANEPVRVQSFGEFERVFGGLWRDSSLSYAVQQFFQNGGTDALIVRVHNGAAAATLTLAAGFNLVAASPGKWGENLRVRVDYNTRPALPTDPPNSLFNLAVRDTTSGVTERFLNLSTAPNNARFVTRVLEQDSNLVRIVPPAPTPCSTTPRPAPSPRPAVKARPSPTTRYRSPHWKRQNRAFGHWKRRTCSICSASRRSPAKSAATSMRRPAAPPRNTANSAGRCTWSIRSARGICTPISPAPRASTAWLGDWRAAKTPRSISLACACPTPCRRIVSPTSRPAARSPA